MPLKLKNLSSFLSLISIFFLVATLALTTSSAIKIKELRKTRAVIGENQSGTPLSEFVPGEILVKFKPEVSALRIKESRKEAVDIEKQEVSLTDLSEETVPQVLKDVNQRERVQKVEKIFKETQEPVNELAKIKKKFANEIAAGTRHINEEEFLKIDLSRIYKLTFSSDTNVEELVEFLNKEAEFEYAELNYKVEATQTSSAPVHQQTVTGGSSSSTTVSTSSNVSFAGGDLNLAVISTKPYVSVASVSGLGRSWTKVASQCAGNNQTGVEVWKSQGSLVENAPVSAELASAPLNAVIAVSSYSGVNASSPIGSISYANTNGSKGACSGGPNTSSYSVNQTTATNSVAFGMIAIRGRTHTPGSGFTERAEKRQGTGSDISGIAIEDKKATSSTSTTKINGTLSGTTNWAFVGIEIKEATPVVLTPTPTAAPAFTNDTFSGFQWALHNTGQTGGLADADIDLKEAFQITQGSEDVVIAIIDTGIDYNHPDLGGCIGANCKVVGGKDFLNNDNDPMDDNGHGTHVAGTAAALTGNNIGVAGVCPKCKLMALKFLNSSGFGTYAHAMASVQYAVNNGARVLNNSYGGGGFMQSFQDLVNWTTASGSLFIAAAGNDNNEGIVYPAGYENVISVASTTNADTKASYSNFGSWVDISAPGGQVAPLPTPPLQGQNDCRYPVDIAILSTVWSGYNSACVITQGIAKYTGLAGTSMASPHASGVAGLLWSKNPKSSSPLTVTYHLKRTIDNIDSINPNFVGKLGTGRLNAHKALTTPFSACIPPGGTCGFEQPPCCSGACDFQLGSCPGIE